MDLAASIIAEGGWLDMRVYLTFRFRFARVQFPQAFTGLETARSKYRAGPFACGRAMDGDCASTTGFVSWILIDGRYPC